MQEIRADADSDVLPEGKSRTQTQGVANAFVSAVQLVGSVHEDMRLSLRSRGAQRK